MTGAEPVRIELRSDPRLLSGAREFVSAAARRFGFPELDCSRIALAIDEALANVICHGYKRRPDGPIWVTLWFVDESNGGPELKVVIEDEGDQVDIENIKGRDLADIRPGGLGVHIIQEVMDKVTYERREPAGMRLVMLKRFDTASNKDAAHG
ncbi:MAG: ATP-binding protein [Phycisphaerales bacterium JB037]